MNNQQAVEAAIIIANNRLDKKRLQPLPKQKRPQDLDEAYKIQESLNNILIKQGLGIPVGFKIGCTTSIMQEYMNITEPSYGEIFSPTVYNSPINLNYADYVEPGVEAEIAVKLGEDLPLTNAPYNINSVIDAIETCMTSIELVDARYFDYRKLDTPTMVADNFFNAACVLGHPHIFSKDTDLENIQGNMKVNGNIIGKGLGSLIMGHPLQALAWLANKLAERNRSLKAGQFITLGSIVTTYWVSKGDLIEVEMSGLGSIKIKFE